MQDSVSRNVSSSSVCSIFDEPHTSNFSNFSTNFNSPSLNYNDINDDLNLDNVNICLSDDSLNDNDTITDVKIETSVSEQEKWCIILIGLPASGKSTISKNIKRYFEETKNGSLKVGLYNAGDIRRKYLLNSQDCNFFNFDNEKSTNLREEFAKISLSNLLNDLKENKKEIGILDATNSTTARRLNMHEMIKKYEADNNLTLNLLFLEVSCFDEDLFKYNINNKTYSPDYINKSKAESIQDFIKRYNNYKLAFEKINNFELFNLGINYINFINLGDDLIIRLNKKNIFLINLIKFMKDYKQKNCSEYLSKIEIFKKSNSYVEFDELMRNIIL